MTILDEILGWIIAALRAESEARSRAADTAVKAASVQARRYAAEAARIGK